jgi:membrane protein
MSSIISYAKDTIKYYQEDKIPVHSASLSYYTVFSLAPLLLIVIAVAGFFFGKSSTEHFLINQFQSNAGTGSGDTIKSILANANKPQEGIISIVVSLVTLILGASGVFGQLQDSLNTIWKSKPVQKNMWRMLRERFLSFSMVVVIGFLLMISLVLSTASTAMGDALEDILNMPESVIIAINIIVSIAIIWLLFTLMYKVLSDITIPWKQLFLPSFLTALLFTIGKELMSLYIAKASVTSPYGAAGSIIAILLWVY